MRKINKFQPKRKVMPQKPKVLNCHICGEPATHVIMLELREKPGPPIRPNDVIRVVCKEHVSTDFDYWVPRWAFEKLCIDLKREFGYILCKQYCTINVLELKKKSL